MVDPSSPQSSWFLASVIPVNFNSTPTAPTYGHTKKGPASEIFALYANLWPYFPSFPPSPHLAVVATPNLHHSLEFLLNCSPPLSLCIHLQLFLSCFCPKLKYFLHLCLVPYTTQRPFLQLEGLDQDPTYMLRCCVTCIPASWQQKVVSNVPTSYIMRSQRKNACKVH